MQFHFEQQRHQTVAIDAVVDLFEGALVPPHTIFSEQAAGAAGHAGFLLDDAALTANLASVTARENLGPQTELQQLTETDMQGHQRRFPNFSVEMETGTGKTYIYIATALRLAALYGLRKFVILVHSIAIRAGVEKTFQQTAEHFRLEYPGVTYSWTDLSQDSAIADFSQPSDTVQFLVANVQLFQNTKKNKIYKSVEEPQLWEESVGVQKIAVTRPILLLDEPQNMKTQLQHKVIATLNPLVALRYSATHAEPFNLVHRLGPKQAFEAELVKGVSVKGIVAGQDGRPYIRLDKVRSARKSLKAKVVIDTAGGKRSSFILENGTDLFELSGKLAQYRGLVVESIERKPDHVNFENGVVAKLDVEIGVDTYAVWRDQIRHTIRTHLNHQATIDSTAHNVKVLSLFFVERVADYTGGEATLPDMFDRLYREEWMRTGRTAAAMPNPAELRVGYFPSTKTGILKDKSSNVEDEERTYQEIIANKELILARENPRAFIFSHSALKEGWDNPNIFQICFLRHTHSERERRQQIGRGLRLPVDQSGRRVTDPTINRLTLTVNESFAEFRDGLNAEYADYGAPGAIPEEIVKDADEAVVVRRRPELFESSDFANLWERIRYKARYRVSVDSHRLGPVVENSKHLESLKDIKRRSNLVELADLRYDDRGRVITPDTTIPYTSGEHTPIVGHPLPNVLQLIEDQLQHDKVPIHLTRPTVAAIVKAILNSSDHSLYAQHALDDPYHWARTVANAIRVEAIEQMVDSIVYEPLDRSEWWDAKVVFLEEETKYMPKPRSDNTTPNNGVSKSPYPGTNLYDHLDYDSKVEYNVAGQLENNHENIKLFTKLPRRFRVQTPVGEYAPDWAILYEHNGTERLYLVRETKGTINLDDLEWSEAMRIRFAKRHFAAAPNGPVDYQHITDSSGLRIESDRDQTR